MNEFTTGLVKRVTLVEIEEDRVLFSSLFPLSIPSFPCRAPQLWLSHFLQLIGHEA